ncbi:MAG: S8 family serine peptidase [Tannerella sp.]|jgi:subtilisin family serine protease|nr:S8 family serine peptidase [Tannerella sp.]
MKKIIISGLFCLATVYTFGQDFNIYVKNKKVSYKVSTTKMLVKPEKMDSTGIKNALTKNTVAGRLKKIDYLHNGIFLVEMENARKENMLELQRQWRSREDVLSASPVFLDTFGEDAGGYTDKVFVLLKSNDDYPVLQKCAGNYHIKDIKPNKFNAVEYILTLPRNSQKNALEIANELHETGLFSYATPDLVIFGKLGSDDTYYPNQWGLNNTGQSGGTAGIDIKADKAWEITTGSSSRKIAILDMGVDLSHPDLVTNLLPGYDAYTHITNGAPANTNGDFPHGTKCAGVAAARGNNKKGIIGVAYGAKILPVTIGAISSGGYFNSTANAIAEAITWSRNQGADVISMSFGTTSSTNVIEALDSAITYGRNGKGCVLVACSHNQNQSSVTFPASHADVIAVGAILNNGLRASYSNYGPDLDVVAPGDSIYTTGIAGTTQNTIIASGTDGVYYSDFCATSAATPFVAGIAALVIDVNPNLTAAEVRSIINMTAQKLPGYAYTKTSAHPDGSWNEKVGYGLVDAQAAVQAATSCTSSLSGQTISSNKFIRSCNTNFTVQSGVTVSNNAKLTIKAAGQVTVNQVFQVSSGRFEIR